MQEVRSSSHGVHDKISYRPYNHQPPKTCQNMIGWCSGTDEGDTKEPFEDAKGKSNSKRKEKWPDKEFLDGVTRMRCRAAFLLFLFGFHGM